MTGSSSEIDRSAWPGPARELWDRLRSHVFDVPGSALPFSGRLARDNAWEREFAEAALEEYRRFCFLAGVVEHPVTPSDEVDQVWHLHLLYTRDYWQVYCPEVLRFELHHGPTRGGAEQGATFLEQYSQTRHSYRVWFGQHPPVGIWPPAEQRFGRDTRWVRVNLDDWELVERRTSNRRKDRSMLDAVLRRLTGRHPVLLLAGLVVGSSTTVSASAQDPRPDSLIDAGFDPYALSADSFLLFFAIVTLAGAVLIPWLAHRRLIAAGRGKGLGATPANVFETAMLGGGDERALLTAVTWLVDRGHARVAGNRMVVESLPAADAHPLVRAVAGSSPGERRAREVMQGRRCAKQLQQLRRALVDKELLLAGPPRPKLSLVVVGLAPILIAVPRIVAALDAGRPFGYLFVLMIAASLVGLVAWKLLVGRFDGATEGGREVMRSHATKQRPALEELDDGCVSAAAMFGIGALAFTDLADVRRFAEAGLRPPQGMGGDGGSTGCGGGGCGGGGCGGCGG